MIRIQPQSWITYKLRGLAKQSFNDFYGGIIDLTTYLKHDSTSAEAYLNRGNCHDKVGNTRLAANDYQHAVKYDSSDIFIYNLAANQLLKCTDSLAAYKMKLKAFQKFSWHLTASVDLAEIEIALRKYDEANSHLNHASQMLTTIQNDAEWERCLYLKGLIHYKKRNYKQAINEFSKVVGQFPGSLESKYLRGKCYLALKQNNHARDEFKDLAVKGYRDSQEIYTSLLHGK